MDFMDVVRRRRSIRRYSPDPVPDDVLNQILEGARLAAIRRPPSTIEFSG